MQDGVGHKGILTKIRTSFAHPMHFNVTTNEASDCNFCEMPLFGVAGHWEREVHVIRWYNGLGYSEIGGGWCEDKGPTQMCEGCTISRIQTVVCPSHELQSMFDDEMTQIVDTAVDELMLAEPGSSEMQFQLQRWCSMCFSLATFGCATLQPSLCGEDETEIVGCGLRLCRQCEVTLKEGFDGDVDLMASAMEQLPKMNEADAQRGVLYARTRADVGFLRKDGLLMRHINEEE